MTRPSLPQNYQDIDGSVLESFETVGDWNCYLSHGTVEEDVTHVIHGSKSVKSTGTTSDSSHTIDKAINTTVGDAVDLWFYLESADITSIRLYFGKDVVGTFTNYFKAEISKSVTTANGTYDRFGPGWNVVRITRDMFAATGTISWTDVMKKIAVSLVYPGASATAYFDVVMAGYKPQPKILFCWDNGYASAYDLVYPLMTSLGVRGTIGVVKDFTGLEGRITPASPYAYECMSLAELQEMYAAGWGMANHSKRHVQLTYTGYPSIQANYDEIAPCSEFLEENGMPRAARHFIYPAGKFSYEYTYPALAQAGMLTARSCIETPSYNLPEQTPYEKYRLRTYELRADRSVQSVLDEIDTAIQYGGSLMIFGHITVASGATGARYNIDDLETVVRYAISKNVPIQTIDEWYNGLTNPRYRSLPMGRT